MSLSQFSKDIQIRSELYAQVFSACQKLLSSTSAKETKDYLSTRISSHAAKKYNFGYFPTNEQLGELFELVDKEILYNLGIVYDKTITYSNVSVSAPFSLFPQNQLIFSFNNFYGDFIGAISRTILPKNLWDKSTQKYKYSKGINKKMHLFNMQNAKQSIINKDYAILVEGQIDAISAVSNGFHNVVCIGGASLSVHQFNILSRLTDNFYFLLDNDQAGEKGYKSAQDKFSSKVNINKIELPSKYKDVDEYLCKSDNYSIFEI